MARSKGGVKKVSHTKVKTGVQSPVVWILGIGAVLLVVVVILTLKKKSQDAPAPKVDDGKTGPDPKDSVPLTEVQESPTKKAYNKLLKWGSTFLYTSSA